MNQTIIFTLDTDSERKQFADIVTAIASTGATFEVAVYGPKAVLKFTGGH